MSSEQFLNIENTLFTIAMIGYLLSIVLYALFFALKKEKYFMSKAGTSSFALTTQVLKHETWTPKDVEERQKQLLDIYAAHWELR